MVAAGNVGEFLAPFKGVQVAVVPDCTQQRNRQRTGTNAGLHDAGAGEDVCHGDNLAGVLGVDHSRAAGHGQDEVREQRTEGLVLLPHVVDHHGPVHFADDFVVVQETAVRVECPADLQRDGVHPAALVGQLYPLAFTERTPTTGGAHRQCAGSAGDVCGVAGRDVVGGSFAAHGIFLAFVNLCGRASRRAGHQSPPGRRYFTTGR
jgi:hypothetical protein